MGVVVGSWHLHTISKKFIVAYTIRQNFIDCSEYFPYTDYRTYVCYRLFRKGSSVVSKNETDLINLIRDSANPELVAQYMLNLFLDYLHTHGPSQEKPSAAPLESA